MDKTRRQRETTLLPFLKTGRTIQNLKSLKELVKNHELKGIFSRVVSNKRNVKKTPPYVSQITLNYLINYDTKPI